MSRRARAETARLLERLRADPAACLVAAGGGGFELIGGAGGMAKGRIPASLVRALLASGLLREVAPGRLAAAPAAEAWLKREGNAEMPFRAQHHRIEPADLGAEGRRRVLVNRDESPVSALTRRSGPNGAAWLSPEAAAAAERLRRDFELGNLQPRVTANWSASVNTGRRAGPEAGLTDLTETARSARLRLDRAVQAVGPELSGVVIDVCCFLKGLETVERERQWPVRSAKLVLRLGLESLARHYGLSAAATGRPGGGRLRHWGAEGYRPEVS